MKKWLFLLTFVILVGFGAQSEAVVDPTPDILGAYFDVEANSPSLNIGINVPFNLYFVLTAPTSDWIEGFDFSYFMELPSGMESAVFKLGHTYPPGIIDLTSPVYEATAGNVYLAWPTPVPTTMAVTLLTFQYMFLVPMQAHMTTASASYWNGEIVYTLGTPECSGLVNENCPVATESRSFGTVKALYR